MIADVRVVLGWSAAIWRENVALVTWIVGSSIASAALLVAFPWLWQHVVDAIEGHGDVSVGRLAGWMLAVGVGHALLYTGLQGARAWGNAVVSAHARGAVLRALTAADPEALGAWRDGEVVSRLHDDAGDKIGWFLCSGVFRAWEALLVAAACFAMMLATEPALAVWVVSPLPVLVAAQMLSQGTLAARHQAVQQAIASTSDQVTTTFGAIRVVQASGMVGSATRRFDDAARAERDAEVHAAVVQSGVQLLYQYGWQIALGALLLFGGLEVIAGDLSLGRYVTFEGLLATMVWPMFDLGTLVSRVPQAAVALRRLDDLVALRSAQPVAPEPPPLRAVGLTVEVGGRRLLDAVDLEVAAGARVALVGEVGAGKTTLVEVLSGLRAPTSGQVGGLGAAVASVPQDAALLSGSVRENVLLGRDVPAEVLARAIRVSQLERDLPRLRDGLDTVVGERGVTLSGGQRQRVAIARALAGGPAILLLDDATSALDAEVEAAFWEALDAELPDLGALLVTHRVGTLSTADRVVVLEGGRVVQQGRHADLIARDGVYRQLYGRLRALDRVEG